MYRIDDEKTYYMMLPPNLQDTDAECFSYALSKKLQKLVRLAEKLNVSRQTISKWESDNSSPDIESVVKVSKLFQVSLDDLLQEGETSVTNKNDERITLEDLVRINLHNRRMTLLLISGLIFIMVSILNFAYVMALQSTTLSTQYMLYRYIVMGQYESAPIDYMRLMIPSIIAGVIGLALCLCYAFRSRIKGS